MTLEENGLYSAFIQQTLPLFVQQNLKILIRNLKKSRINSEELLKGFKFPMVSDRTTTLSRYFGILNHDSGNSERGTFIISPDGVLKTIEIHTDAVGRSAKELVRKLYALKFVSENKGHACPASWEHDMKTMQPTIKKAGNAGEALS